ncbi:hypothetical protein HMPREF9554_02209 [Treponema phagedenis F0421]|uniref:hypothetical protein n=1 Tax=Treponema phagedenis TaxID=162 RepID=UPI0001F63F76|nr:hypothetical protein [Treponema phagedenis]EFW37325.1 hypothetical protein HMPREF9554_02209 [Treponema phagedenis F0421]
MPKKLNSEFYSYFSPNKIVKYFSSYINQCEHIYQNQKQNTRENTAYIKIKNAHPHFNHHFHFLKEPDTAQGRRFAFFPFASPTSLKDSILQNSVDALKHRFKFGKGKQTYHRNAYSKWLLPLSPRMAVAAGAGRFSLMRCIKGRLPLRPRIVGAAGAGLVARMLRIKGTLRPLNPCTRGERRHLFRASFLSPLWDSSLTFNTD